MKNNFSVKWAEALKAPLESPTLLKVVKRIKADKRQGHIISPPSVDLFTKFKVLDPEDVRVVFFTDTPIVMYEQSPEWQLLSSWIEKTHFDGFKLNTEDNINHLIPQGIINLSPSLTVCKTDHSNIGWDELVSSILETLYNSPNKVLFVSDNESIKNAIPFEEGCISAIDEWMIKEYNTKIKYE